LSCVPLRHPRWCGCPKDVPGRGRRRQLRYAVGVAPRRLPGARLALPPPFPAWGLGPLRRETSAATVATTRRRGRCYTGPCARAKGPSSFSAVRRQVWLNYPTTHPTPRGERSSLDTDSRACAARSRRLSGVRLASSIWLVCDFGPSRIFRVTGWLGVVGLGGRWAGFSSVGLRLVRLLFLFRLGCWSVCSSLSISVVGWATSSVCRSLVWVGVGVVVGWSGRRVSCGWFLGAAVGRAVSLVVRRRASWGVCFLSRL
jgi:hypothetical protein